MGLVMFDVTENDFRRGVDMEIKGLLLVILVALGGLSLFIQFSKTDETTHRIVEYNLTEMYEEHKFEGEFQRFDFWDLVTKEDIDRLRGNSSAGMLGEALYRAGIYTWTLYSFYAWDRVEKSTPCPDNMSREEFGELLEEITPRYRELREERERYLEKFRELEANVSDPQAYALLAWLELQLAYNNPDFNYDSYAGEYGFSEGVCKALLAIPEFYENYVFPYVEEGIAYIKELNSGSSGGEILSERTKLLLENKIPVMEREISRIYKNKQGRFEVLGARGGYYTNMSKNCSSAGLYSLALFYMSWAEGYLAVTEDPLAKVPMSTEYFPDISAVRNEVYAEVLDLITELHSRDFRTLDPLLPEFLLYHIARMDYVELPKVVEKDSPFYSTWPPMVYLDYLDLLARTRGVRILYEHLTSTEG